MDLPEDVIVDSELNLDEALRQNPKMPAPEEVLKRQRLLDVLYYGFDKKLHKGQIVVDVDLVEDVKGAFEFILQEKFPLKSVIPSGSRKYRWNDNRLGISNNSSGFNYRFIAKTKRLSKTIFSLNILKVKVGVGEENGRIAKTTCTSKNPL